MFLKKRIAGLVVVSMLLATSEVKAEYVWYSYGGHEYALTLTRNNWLGAEAKAEAVGGHLATINDNAEMDMISNTFKDAYLLPYPPGSPNWGNGAAVWIGLEYQESSWEWVTGELYTGFPEPNALSGGVDTPYGIGWSPGGGPHAYLHTAYHPNPGTVTNDSAEDTYQYWYPYGVIERDPGTNPIPTPSTLVGLVSMGLVGLVIALQRRFRKAA